jgi:signal transduction histidine kinase
VAEKSGDGTGSDLPVALAAVSVDGRCRERNPADLAIFGPDRDRLVERFATPAEGQALFVRCSEAGTAEGTSWLVTAAGEQPFRISLWRQRGGDRIRIVAAFAACGAVAPASAPRAPQVPSTAAPIGREMHSPLRAAMGFAERLRSRADSLTPEETATHASDILAATWRLMRLADDLVLAARGAGGPLPLHVSEVDVARLTRRILRLAGPAAEAAGVSASVAPATAVPLVLADESVLWTLIDRLVELALAAAGRGGSVTATLCAAGGGLSLELGVSSATGALPRAPADMDLDACAAQAQVNGARLETPSGPEGGAWTVRLAFAQARCLDPA